jgi:hypothetical protein
MTLSMKILSSLALIGLLAILRPFQLLFSDMTRPAGSSAPVIRRSSRTRLSMIFVLCSQQTGIGACFRQPG